MDALITLIIYVVLFAAVAYGCWWVCTHFGLPAPVLWTVGAILLICILLFVVRQIGPVSLPVMKR